MRRVFRAVRRFLNIKMPCSQSQLLSAYHDGELTAAQRQELELHIAQCPACAAELTELQSISNLFTAAARPHLSHFSQFRIRQAAEALPRDQILRLARRVRAIAACVLLGASVWLWNQSGGVSGTEQVSAPPPQVDLAITATEATQNMDATSPAAAWYLADASSRSDYPR